MRVRASKNHKKIQKKSKLEPKVPKKSKKITFGSPKMTNKGDLGGKNGAESKGIEIFEVQKRR